MLPSKSQKECRWCPKNKAVCLVTGCSLVLLQELGGMVPSTQTCRLSKTRRVWRLYEGSDFLPTALVAKFP